MKEQDARAILKAAFETSQMLEILAAELVGRMTEADARTIRQNIGYTLAEIGERLIDPVFAAYPQYQPIDNTGDAWRELARSVGARDMREL